MGRFAIFVKNLLRYIIRNNGIVPLISGWKDFVRMTRKLIIKGEHFNVNFFKQTDGTIRVEVSHSITGKHFKMFPDNLINFEES